jgi:hypothetical protein
MSGKLPSFDNRVKELKNLYSMFSLEDIHNALLSSYLWLPNCSSPIKHQFLYSVLISMDESALKSTNQIRNYGQLKAFLKDAYKLTPSFVSTEDYLPERDWGDVKFYHSEKSYNIFYGNELELVHEFLMEFQIIHNSIDEQYLKVIHESSVDELEFCLRMQDWIINQIALKDFCDDKKNISPGHIELPSEEFWKEIVNFTENFNNYLNANYDESYLRDKSIMLGEFKMSSDEGEFSELVFHGKLLPQYFLYHNNKFYSLMPRRYSSNILDEWAQKFYQNREELRKHMKVNFNLEWGSNVYEFVKGRCRNDYLFPLVSSQEKSGKPCDLIFDFCMLINDKLIMFHVLSGPEDVEEVNKKVKITKNQLKEKPMTIAHHLKGKSMQIVSDDENVILKPLFIIILPDFDPAAFTHIAIGKEVDFLIGLRHFLAIFDGCKDENEFLDFLEYEQEGEIKTSPLISISDKFGAYKDSQGVMNLGAREPDMYFLDPHWGTDLRYRTLKEFWLNYPEAGFFDHPRTWSVERETPTRVRLIARGFFGFALYTKLSNIDIFLNAPFDKMNLEQGELSNFLIECIEDSLNTAGLDYGQLNAFKYLKYLQIIVFPNSLITDEEFKHIGHLKCGKDELWQADILRIQRDKIAIRLVFNEEPFVEMFSKHDDNMPEYNLLLRILDLFNEFEHDSRIDDYKKQIENNFKGRTPRFKLFSKKVDVPFPDLVKFYRPTVKEEKEARKLVGKIALNCAIKPGKYASEKGKVILNQLKMGLVKEVENIIKDYNFKECCLQLIPMLDSITNDFNKAKISINNSFQLDVDYIQTTRLYEIQSKFEHDHKNHRYLLEKFIQIKPTGKKKLTNYVIKSLLALIDEIHLLQSNSDSLNYLIFETAVEISEDFVCKISNDDGYLERESEYAEKQAGYDLGRTGNPEDKVKISDIIKDLMEDVSTALKQDLGLRLDNMTLVLDVLSGWAEFKKGKVEACYEADLEDIKNLCLEKIKNISSEEIEVIIDFLTIKSDKLLTVQDQDELCVDLPIWEIAKREHRYILKPLLKIDDKYYWGALSTNKVRSIWLSRLELGTLPHTVAGKEIDKTLQKYKRIISKKLEDKANEIMLRFTPYTIPNLFLDKRDRKYPQELGDYDVLAYEEKTNTLFNIECKDILLPFCAKDSARMRNKIFGDEKDKNEIGKIENREKFLANNYQDIFNTLNWKINPKKKPKIKSIYISRAISWWTEFPPYSTSVIFTRIDALEELVK